MIDKVYDYMEKTGMFNGVGGIVAGLSGGADSVCLILTLKSIIQKFKPEIRLAAVHVNHGIRGEEARRDEEFSKRLSESLGVEFFAYHRDIPAAARETGMSEEEAGRCARYAIFRETAERIAAGIAEGKPEQSESGAGAETEQNESEAGAKQRVVIAVAHHMDDQAETFLMHLIRGAGVQGLSGMEPVSGDIIRPLLCVSRREIEAFLEERGQDYVVDSTNSDDSYTRNRIRNVLMPLLRKEFNSNISDILCSTADDMRKLSSYVENGAKRATARYAKYEYGAQRKPERCVISGLSRFMAEDAVIKERVVRNILFKCAGTRKNIYRRHIEAVLELASAQTGKSLNLPHNITVRRSYDELVFETCQKKQSEFFDAELVFENDRGFFKDRELSEGGDFFEDGDFSEEASCGSLIAAESGDGKKFSFKVERYIYFGGRLCFLKDITFEIMKNVYGNFTGNDYTKYFDYDKIKSNIHLRFKMPGDYFEISCGGTKKLKSELIDVKIPQEYRNQVLLLAQGNKILWAFGVRRGQSYQVDESTDRAVRVCLNIQEEN